MEDPLWRRLTTDSSAGKRKRANRPLCEGRWSWQSCSARIEGCDGHGSRPLAYWLKSIGSPNLITALYLLEAAVSN